jgi:prepilin-type N-terminal cleavage/methylation domain-containing protein
MKKIDKGFTLIELLVGIAVASMIFVVACSLVVSIINFSVKSSKSQVIEQVKNDIVANLSTDIRWANKINIGMGSDTLTIKQDSGNVVYALTGSRLSKNGSPLTSRDIKVTNFSVDQKGGQLEVNIAMENSLNPSIKDSLDFIISPRNKEALK